MKNELDTSRITRQIYDIPDYVVAALGGNPMPTFIIAGIGMASLLCSYDYQELLKTNHIVLQYEKKYVYISLRVTIVKWMKRKLL